jgi:hypothetical protein
MTVPDQHSPTGWYHPSPDRGWLRHRLRRCKFALRNWRSLTERAPSPFHGEPTQHRDQSRRRRVFSAPLVIRCERPCFRVGHTLEGFRESSGFAAILLRRACSISALSRCG